MISTTKNKRYKPLYKKFIRLKKNVQHRPKFFKSENGFKKRKWQSFLLMLNRRLKSNQRSKTLNLYDNNRFFIPRFGSKFQNKFKENLIFKQQFSIYYGHLTEKTIKKYVKLALSKVKLQSTNTDPTFFLIQLLETRLDSILYKSQFVLSFKEAHDLILKGHIKVNGTIAKKKSLRINQGDLITLDSKIFKKIYSNFLFLNIKSLPPKHLCINYKTLQILYFKDVKELNSATFFPFKVNFKSIIRQYRH